MAKKRVPVNIDLGSEAKRFNPNAPKEGGPATAKSVRLGNLQENASPQFNPKKPKKSGGPATAQKIRLGDAGVMGNITNIPKR